MNVDRVLATQAGVVSRRQLLAAGESGRDVERRLARRELTPIHPGVYVIHTGPPTWTQHAWAAVLFYEPAALAHDSALAVAGVRGYSTDDAEPIHVCVDRTRSVRRRVGVVVHQRAHAEGLWVPNLLPPRESVEHAVLGVASAKRRLESAIAAVADVVQTGRTTPARLLEALTSRPKLRHRAALREALADVQQGVRSVLEYRYLHQVERAHGLPVALRQGRVRVMGRPAYPDVEYLGFALRIELDGHLRHQDALDMWADLDRDLAAALDSILTLRVGWRQVLDPCRLAAMVGAVLRHRGWSGQLRSCGPVCTAISGHTAERAVHITW